MNPEDIKKQVTERLKTITRSAEPDQAQSTAQPSGDVPSVGKEHKPALYELDRYVKLRDPLMLMGIGFVLFGVGAFSMPVMYILGGLVLVGLSWMMAR